MPSRSIQAPPMWTTAVMGLVLVVLAGAVTLGADTMWLVAMGNHIVHRGLPEGVPFAIADSSGWVNVPVLGEVVFSSLAKLGPLGLPAAQLVADAAVMFVLLRTAHGLGARDASIALSLLLLAVGALPSLGVVRAQLLSLVPFAILVLLLMREHRSPSRRIWLLVPLIAVWGNLHGAVLAGIAVAGTYLAFSRIRVNRMEALGVGAAAVASLWLTPAGFSTPKYYLSVLGNEAARRGSELWATPNLQQPFDVLMVLSAIALGALALSRRRPAWEYVVVAGLTVGTISAARHGIWLVLFLAVPAADALTAKTSGLPKRRAGAPPGASTALLAMGLAVASSFTLASRVDALAERGKQARIIASAVGTAIVLAPEPLVEDLAAAGARVWVSNPIDAFDRVDQAAYLDFVSGSGPGADRALAAAEVVVVEADSAQFALAVSNGFVESDRIGKFAILRKRGAN